MSFSIEDKVRESNRIEGIHRDPTMAECAEFRRFLALERVTIADLIRFVGIYQPGAVVRDRPGLNVRVGYYFPPSGGMAIVYKLAGVLHDAQLEAADPWAIHVRYEQLHPFTDGNGRSGRMLWYWMMAANPLADLGFLHAFYYQTLSNAQQHE